MQPTRTFLVPVLACAAILLAVANGLSAASIDISGQCRWQVTGNQILIEAARVENDSQGGTSGTLRLQVWATQTPYNGGSISGYIMGTHQLGQLQGNQYYYDIQATRPFTQPPSGTYYTTMTVEEYTGSGFVIRDYVSFTGTTPFGGGGGGGGGGGDADLSLEGTVSYNVSGKTVTVTADRISNYSDYVRSGTLRLQLWATTTPYAGGGIQGYILGTSRLTTLGANQYLSDISHSTRFTAPPNGTYYITMTLEEYNSPDGFLIVDYRNFDNVVTLGTGIGGQPGGDGGDLEMSGRVTYAISKTDVTFSVPKLSNRRWTDVSGSLRLSLWASATPYTGGARTGSVLGTANVGPLAAGFYINKVRVKGTYLRPAPGSYYMTIFLEEYVNGSYRPLSYVTFPKAKKIK